MIGFGLCVGLVFPWFVTALGIPAEFVLTPWFFLTCIAAGFLVGATSILLAKSAVGRRLRLLSERMNLIASKLEEISLQLFAPFFRPEFLSRARPARLRNSRGLHHHEPA